MGVEGRSCEWKERKVVDSNANSIILCDTLASYMGINLDLFKCVVYSSLPLQYCNRFLICSC